jgi:hypothetical protein
MDTTEKAPDPPKWVLELVDSQQTEQMLDIVNRQFPKWITHISNGYHTKYNTLNRNWKDICDNLKCKPEKILLVSTLPTKDDEDQQLAAEMAFACDFLTQKGFIIRRDIEFLKCKSSDRVYPCKELYNEMRKRKVQVPHVWEKL